jgi:hypothetical protein
VHVPRSADRVKSLSLRVRLPREVTLKSLWT